MSGLPSQLRERLWVRHALLAAVALGAALLALVSYETGALGALELSSVDARFEIRGAEAPGHLVAIVAVDQRTLTALHARPPIPRSYYAQVLDRLRAARARLVAVDVQFIGKTDSHNDGALLAAIARDGPILLASHDSLSGLASVPAGVRNAPGAILGSAAVDTDADGVVRRMIYAPLKLRTLAVRAAELLQRSTLSQQDFPDNHAWADFRGPPGTFPTYSLVDVLDGRVPSRLFSGKAVLIGVTDPVEKDVFLTAASSNPMSGVEFHANALTTILAGFPLQPVGDAIEIALLFVFAALPALLSLRLAALPALAATIGILLVFLIAAQVAFDSGLIVSVPEPILALALGTIGSVAAESSVQRRQLRNLQELFDLLPSPVSDFFISYRREQSELAANTLREGLAKRFGEQRVFMDTDGINPGQEWPRRIDEAIAACRAMLVVIGPQWLDARTADGRRRLEDPEDWVGREIVAGLAREEIAVVPVLHDGAREPKQDELPDSLKVLAHCQAVQLSGRELEHWIDELVASIQSGRLKDARQRELSVAARSNAPTSG